MKIIYRADDGKEFESYQECFDYEDKQKANFIYSTLRKLFNELSSTYFNDNGDDYKVDDRNLTIWITSDIQTILLEKKANVEEIDEFFVENFTKEEREVIYKYIHFDEIVENANIRIDFYSALKNVHRGSELSHKIGFAFSDKDISNLAKLHKANKCRKKIEDLLTDCNFHSECSDFMNKNYAPYIKD